MYTFKPFFLASKATSLQGSIHVIFFLSKFDANVPSLHPISKIFLGFNFFLIFFDNSLNNFFY